MDCNLPKIDELDTGRMLATTQYEHSVEPHETEKRQAGKEGRRVDLGLHG